MVWSAVTCTELKFNILLYCMRFIILNETLLIFYLVIYLLHLIIKLIFWSSRLFRVFQANPQSAQSFELYNCLDQLHCIRRLLRRRHEKGVRISSRRHNGCGNNLSGIDVSAVISRNGRYDDSRCRVNIRWYRFSRGRRFVINVAHARRSLYYTQAYSGCCGICSVAYFTQDSI